MTFSSYARDREVPGPSVPRPTALHADHGLSSLQITAKLSPRPLAEALDLSRDGLAVAPCGEDSALRVDEHSHRRLRDLAEHHPQSDPSTHPADTSNGVVPSWLQAAYNLNDGRSAGDERARLREGYEKDGWLRSPTPGRRMRNMRMKAIYLLGLTSGSSTDTSSKRLETRLEIIAKCCGIVQELLQTDRVMATIFRDRDAICVDPSWDGEIEFLQLEEIHESHFFTGSAQDCFVHLDMSSDWRLANNPRRRELDMKFVAAAPLLFRQDQQHVINIGALYIYDHRPEATVDTSKQTAILRVAELLVSQLFALQSQDLQEWSNMMYETCISFQTRSIAQIKGSYPPSKDGVVDEANQLRGTQDSLSSHQGAPDRLPHVLRSSRRPTEMAVKASPREVQSIREQDIRVEHQVLQDYCTTLRDMLKADVVTLIGLEDFSIGVKPISDATGREDLDIHEIIAGFGFGTPFPPDAEPIIQSTSRNEKQPVVSYTCPPQAPLRVGAPYVRVVLRKFLKRYLQEQQFWWDVQAEEDDDLSRQVLALLPSNCRTALSTVYMTPDATPKFVTLVGWNRPASTFDETSISYVPYAWVLSGSLRATLAVRRNLWLERAQLTYANTQTHNLKTPLHQILTVTQVLRSAMGDLAGGRIALRSTTAHTDGRSAEQIRDLLPYLDAIDTSGNHLHAIVDNILSFLELKGMERVSGPESGMDISLNGDSATQSLNAMLQSTAVKAYDAETRARRSRGDQVGRIETVFHAEPEELAQRVMEDSRGLMKASLAKIIANAYKAITGTGCVEISLSCDSEEAESESPRNMQSTSMVRISIKDDGVGMDEAFVRDELGEPWAKEDPNATGSGLSVYLAFRMIDLLDGHMEICSSAGKGCTVNIAVPLPLGPVSHATTDETSESETEQLAKKVFLAGFDGPSGQKLGAVLEPELRRLGTEVVDLNDAEIVIANGTLEEQKEGLELLSRHRKIVYLVFADHSPLPEIVDLQEKLHIDVRRLKKPVTSWTTREALRNQTNSLDTLQNTSTGTSAPNSSTTRAIDCRTRDPWDRSPQADTDDVIASLALGEAPDGHSRSTDARVGQLSRQPSSAPPASGLPGKDDPVPVNNTPLTAPSTLDAVNILVVEDNLLNRKILVKLLQSGPLKALEPPLKIVEAGDGEEAVEKFRDFTEPTIILLDINM